MVMRSVENARVALEDGDADKAIKMMISADQLCARVVAPPTIHGLATYASDMTRIASPWIVGGATTRAHS